MLFTSAAVNPELFLKATERMNDARDAWRVFCALQIWVNDAKRSSSQVEPPQAEKNPQNRDQEWACRLLKTRNSWY